MVSVEGSGGFGYTGLEGGIGIRCFVFRSLG